MNYKNYDRGHIHEGYDHEIDFDDHHHEGYESTSSNQDNETEATPLFPTYHGDGALFGQFREYTMAIRLRHSPIYIGFNIFVLALTAFLVAWVILSTNHKPNGRLFFFVETIVTVAVVLDLAVEVSYYGSEAYFTGRGTSRGEDDYSVVRCLSHWFQLVVTVLCVVALLLYFFVPNETGHAAVVAANKFQSPKGWHVVDDTRNFGPADEDNFVSLFLLLVRYVVYVVFMITSSTRTMQLQGCCDRNKEWEISLNNDEDPRDSWMSE
jgi:hypothetical protein